MHTSTIDLLDQIDAHLKVRPNTDNEPAPGPSHRLRRLSAGN
jgi:hypothetical protein